MPSSRECLCELLPLDRTAWGQVADAPTAFAAEHALTLGAEPDLLRAVGRQTVALLERTGAAIPWSGYLAVDRSKKIIIGTCAFTAPPDSEGVVEIAYFTFPQFEGQGYASAMAAGLLERAERAVEVRRVRAHTLPENNASTHILEKLGFERVGEVIDPEDGPVWRWDREPISRVSRPGSEAPVEIVPYDLSWPRQFIEEEQALRRALAAWLVGPVEHIGSTAVPGLAAKPVVDIMAGVETLDASRPAIVELADLGYCYAPYRTESEHWFCKPSPAFRTHHLHLIPLDSPRWTETIAFRDYLRSHPRIAAEYADLKRHFAEVYRFDREAYTEAKGPFIARITALALQER
jgi:GrpB-like predicted nucleotidyltransferase (UPF0157 family)/GNAT superfamily N-acetyltransferase